MKVILGTFLGLVLTLSLAAQQPSKTPLLERSVTISFTQEPLPAALKKIAEQAGFTFSYNSGLIDANRKISDQFINKTVREILDQLFGGTLQYKERKKHVILTKAETSSSNDAQKVSGYVVDEATGQRVKNASIYDPISMSSAVTDAYGYFQLEVPKPSNAELKLTIKKLNYADTVVAVTRDKQGLIHIPLKIDEKKIGAVADSIGVNLKRFWLSTKRATEQIVNMENIEDTLHANFQVSVVPFVGTNNTLSGNVVSDYSFNVLGGYSLGVDRFEVGTLFNAVRGDVTGVQLAGLINAVGGETRGFQMAGWINANRGPTSGAQVAGFINFNWSTSSDFAAAGFINFSYHDSHGVKLAGLGNTTIGEQRGPHFAGLFNFSGGQTSSAQVAGMINYAGKQMRGTQVSGILNVIPAKITGGQIGLVNYASSVNGMQIGFLNIVDSMQGVPIGFLSFVNRGYHKIEVSADEIFYTNLAFRTGVHQFYNIFAIGAKPDSFQDEPFWTFGYGVGTSPRLSRRLYLNADLTANQIVNGTSIEAINLLNKLYLGLEFQAARKFSIALGATLNGYVTDTTYDGYKDLFTDYKPDMIAEEDLDNNLNLKMWLGGKVAIRFL